MMVAMCRALCSAPSINTDHLRYQLDQLHSEAELTRRKANNARFRLIRLSEAAENLGRQAAVSVWKGKEDDARELLFQKKKVMSALEKSKGRVELLDELAAKLNEAISIKEAQLVRNVASDLEIDGDDAEGSVRIVSPSQDDRKTLNEDKKVTFNVSDVGEDRKFVADIAWEGNTLSYSEAEQLVPESISCGNEATMFSSFRGPSSHIVFFEELDQQLKKIEKDLVTILELPTIVQDDENRPKKSEQSKILQSRILQNIRDARLRIRKYVQEIVRNM